MMDEALLDALYEHLPSDVLARIWVRSDGTTALMPEPDGGSVFIGDGGSGE